MTADRLTPQRETEIAESDLGEWYQGEWRSEYIETTPDRYAHYVVKHQESGHILAELPDFAGPIALFIADAHEAVPELLAELAAVRAERDEARERALDALNRSVEDGREVCADCGRPVPDGPCGVHSPDAVYQRACQEAAALRAERDALAKRLHDAAMTRTWRNEDGKKFVFVEDIAPALLGITPGTEASR